MLETTVAAIAVAAAVGALVLMAVSSVLPDLLDGYATRRSGPGVTGRRDRCRDNGGSSERARRSGAELALLEPGSPLNRDAPRPGLG